MAFFLTKQKNVEKYFFISEYFLTLLIIKYNNMKTFTITEEQVKELSKWKHGKRLMQDWFPEAFEKQLEVGKVYKYPSLGGGKFMFKFNGEFSESTYGFASNGEWSNELGIRESEINDYKEATKEEWLEALKNEARKRGFKKGVKYNYVDKPYLTKIFKDELDLGCSADLVDGDDIILEDGVWAEVIKEEIPTQEEIDRVLNYLKNKNNS